MADRIDPNELLLNSLPLPTDWTDALSTLEMLAALTTKVNTLIDAVNTLSTTVTDLSTSVQNLNEHRVSDEIKILGNQQHIGYPYDTTKGSLDERVSALETSVQTNTTNIGNLTWANSFINNAIGMPYTNAKNISTRLNDLETE